MKKLLFSIGIVILMGCEKKDIKLEQIESTIKENALGEDLNYKVISTEKVDEVTYNDILEVFMKVTESEDKPIDTLIAYTQRAKELQRQDNDAELYHYFDFLVNRLKLVNQAKNKDDVAYSIYKHNYSIVNPMFNNTKVSIENYYFFDNNEKLLYYFDDSTFKENIKANIQHDKQPYEAMVYLKQ